MFRWNISENDKMMLCQLIPNLSAFRALSWPMLVAVKRAGLLAIEFLVLLQHGAADVIVQRIQIWRAWRPLILVISAPGQFAELLLHDARSRTLRNGSCLGWVVIILSFSYIFQSKFGAKVYVFLLTSCVIKVSFKNLHSLLKCQQKSQGLLFMFTLYIVYSIPT